MRMSLWLKQREHFRSIIGNYQLIQHPMILKGHGPDHKPTKPKGKGGKKK